jgi:hypothetical protein
VAHLPRPADVGKAIAAYLQNGRPRVPGTRRLFLRAPAPLTGCKGQGSVGSVVKPASCSGVQTERCGPLAF